MPLERGGYFDRFGAAIGLSRSHQIGRDGVGGLDVTGSLDPRGNLGALGQWVMGCVQH